MAIGFQSGMFGRKPMRNPWDTPGIGDGFNQRLETPAQASEMPIGAEQMGKPKKQSFFGQGGVGRMIAGTIGDFLMQNAGMQPVYGPTVLQQRDMQERIRMAQAQRMQAREDKLWEWQNKPKDAPNNDTINDFNWYKNLPEEDRKLYHKMKPVVGYMADGTPRIINPYEAQQQDLDGQPASEDGFDYTPGPGGRANPQNWKKSGGQAVTPPVTFRR